MATVTVTRCDRCRSEAKNPKKSLKVTVGRHFSRFGIERPAATLDLCERCRDSLLEWIQRDNATTPGGRVGWRERCTHHVPCAGPCNSGVWERV